MMNFLKGLFLFALISSNSFAFASKHKLVCYISSEVDNDSILKRVSPQGTIIVDLSSFQETDQANITLLTYRKSDQPALANWKSQATQNYWSLIFNWEQFIQYNGINRSYWASIEIENLAKIDKGQNQFQALVEFRFSDSLYAQSSGEISFDYYTDREMYLYECIKR